LSAPILANDAALETARRAKLFVLDIDGVLLDPRPSFYTAAQATASWGARLALDREDILPVTTEEISAFKAVGGWNDDFDLACACTWALIIRETLPARIPVSDFALLVAGGLPPLEKVREAMLPSDLHSRLSALLPTRRIREHAAVRYAGRARCLDLYGIHPDGFADLPAEGFCEHEPRLCAPETLALLGGPFAIFTGRNGPETEMALERLDLFVPPELRAVDDGKNPRKPAPDALLALAATTPGPLVFLGDSIDDERAAQTYEALAQFRALPELIFVRIHAGNLDEVGTRAPVVATSLDVFARTLRSEAREQTA
jgi:phosphoglycolate phosphatase-like HAD superfamily hydrolase